MKLYDDQRVDITFEEWIFIRFLMKEDPSKDGDATDTGFTYSYGCRGSFVEYLQKKCDVVNSLYKVL